MDDSLPASGTDTSSGDPDTASALEPVARVGHRVGHRLWADRPVHTAHELCNPQGVGHIILDEAVYTLRITRNRKLILTK